jgi:ABC-type arginine/histidine transport system permease subunit
MSILNENYNPSSFLTPEIQVLKLKNEAKTIYDKLFNGVRYSTELFWNNPSYTPQQLAEAAGTSAAELFQLHSIAINALEQAVPDSSNEIINLIKPYTINEDGTVTIL